jgi:RNA polymerase sigma-70 factor (ECF subfamily)
MTAKLIPLRRTDGSIVEMSDVALLAACAVGESAALAALFDRYHLDVYRFLNRISGAQHHDIDDLVQTTFLELHCSAHRFQARASVKTWIFGIAANVARHHARSERRRRLFALAVAAQPEPPSARPDEQASRSELSAKVALAIDALSHDLRVAFVMCDVEGIPGVDAARTLGLREGTLWRRLHDARKRLRALIEGEP